MLNVNFNIVYTIINILILFFIFRVFLFKRVDKVLKARNDEVENATVAADRKSHDADEAKAKYDDDIQKLEDEKESIISESREKGYHECNRNFSHSFPDFSQHYEHHCVIQ